MNELNKNTDKVFRDKLGNYSVTPPEESWTVIKNSLKGKPKRRILIPLWQVAAGMALLISAGGILYVIDRNSINEVARNINQVPFNQHFEVQPPEVVADETPVKNNPQDIRKDISDNHLKNSSPASVNKKTLAVVSGNGIITEESVNDKQMALHSGFSQEMMNEPYLQPAQNDLIPRKNNSVTANWQMLSDELTPEKEEQKHLLLSAQVSPTYTYRDIPNMEMSSSAQSSNNETGKITYSGGMQLGYKTSERLSIHTGLMYSRLGYNINQVGSYNLEIASNKENAVISSEEKMVYTAKNSVGSLSSVITQSNGVKSDMNYSDFPVMSNPDTEMANGKIEQYFSYLEIPFLLRYKILDSKLDVNLIGGVSTNILVGNLATLSADNLRTQIGPSEDIRNFNYMGNMGLGFDYAINKNLLISMEPQFKYFLNSINRENLIVNHPYMLGMFTGIKYIW